MFQHFQTPSASTRPAYYTVLYYTILDYTILYYTILYYTILYHTILYYTILYYTILYYTILYYTILYYTILYYTILYYTILYYTFMLYCILISHPTKLNTLSQPTLVPNPLATPAPSSPFRKVEEQQEHSQFTNKRQQQPQSSVALALTPFSWRPVVVFSAQSR